MDPTNFLSSLFVISASAAALLAAALTAFVFWLASRFFKSWLMPRLCRLAEKMHLKGLYILLCGFSKPLPVLIWLAGLCIALPMLPLPSMQVHLSGLGQLGLRFSLLGCGGWGLWNATDLCELAMQSLSAKLDMKANVTLLALLKKTYRVLVIAFVVLAMLDLVGIPVTGLITGFGLAGLTVSLAAQDSASNLFSGLIILMERPFAIGDWITVNGVDGEVEDLTFRSTKIRALDNTLYVLPNSSVTNATINNSDARTKRLFRFNLNLTFDSSREKLEQLMDSLLAHLKADPELDAGSVIVRLTGFSESGVTILVSAYVLHEGLQEFLDVQNRLNLDIMDMVRAQDLHFAMTASRVYLESDKAEV